MNFSLSTRIPQTLLLTVGLVSPALAQVPNTFQNGQVAKAEDVNANFTNLNGRVQTAQDAASAAAATASAAATQTEVTALSAIVGATPTTGLQGAVNSLTSQITVSGNNVGIGTANPSEKLQVVGNALIATPGRLYFGSANENTDPMYFERINPTTNVSRLRLSIGDDFPTAQLDTLEISRLTVPIVTFVSNGRVGIGTTNPTRGQVEIVSGSTGEHTVNGYGFLSQTGATTVSSTGVQVGISLWIQETCAARDFVAFSDARIKHIEGRSDMARDLATLQAIEVADYTHIDTIANGSGKQKKVIAQQVEAVFPQAVTRSTDVVPDIYQRATIKDGWVSLATNLQKGERVRLIGAKTEGVHEVLEVTAEGFRTAFAADAEAVFVYGREVNDFRNVDYDAIAMLNVSATQDLARQVEAKDRAIVALQGENDDLRQRLEALEAAVAQLQPLLTARK